MSPITPFTSYNHSIELRSNISYLWWTVNEMNGTILFELHMNTTGWIALGISPTGGMTGADIGVGWVDGSGNTYFQDRYAFSESKPMIDNTTTDWFVLQGREANGWTAIQFTRLLDTCDSMDVAIRSGTNHLIFAYGLVDPSLSPPISDITYHETRRGLYTLSLRSYSDPPLQSKFAGLDSFEFRLNPYTIPPTDTTYYCQIFKAPSNYSTKRHVFAHKILINSSNIDIVHHLLMYECDPIAKFNDSNLPGGICDDIYYQISLCVTNIATGWAVGGDFITEFPSEAGYPVGGNFSIKYYLIQMHYNNPNLASNRVDNSGIRFYVGNELRQYDIGYLTFGTYASAVSLVIPPQVENFQVDSYCPTEATSNFPTTGITVVTAFPHTHIQGKSIWTKIIRNKIAVEYLFNAESYDFNYQFENRLPERIQLYPGDELATRCVYNTMNKNVTTLGGERTKDEMCLHMFTYYPRINNFYICISINNMIAWGNFVNVSNLTESSLESIVTNITWTSDLAVQWQNFYNNAPRVTMYGRSIYLNYTLLPKIPAYVDLKQENCTKSVSSSANVIWPLIKKYLFFVLCISFLL